MREATSKRGVETEAHERANADLRTSFRDPPRVARPKIRWTWPGVAVEADELRAELREMLDAGYGAAEVSNMECGLPPAGNPPETCSWGTDHWTTRIQQAARAAKELGMRMDLTVGPAWPWASPTVSGDQWNLSQQELIRGDLRVPAGRAAPRHPPEPVDAGERARLIAVIAARLISSRAGPQLLDPESLHVVPVEAPGRIDWCAPDGDWRIFAFWQRPTGQRAKGTSSDVCDHPLVVDHLRRESIEAALGFLDRQLVSRLDDDADVFEELFEDSLELETEGLLWTSAFLDEFRARRGYDLTPFLPVVDRASLSTLPDAPKPARYDLPGDAGLRIRRDYHQTLTELWIDHHILPMRRWANARGMRCRVQAYGEPFATLAVSKAIDVPETEDLYSNTLDFWRTVSSAAHMSGAEKVSMEHGAVIHADFMMTLEEVKRRADRAFVAGVTQLVTHVYPYKRAAGARWPSWTPWSSAWFGGGFSDAWNAENPQWPHMRSLTDYMARAQLVLRAGRPVMDLAVYRDLYGYPNAHGHGTRAPFGDDPREPELNAALSRSGLTFDFIDPATLTDPAAVVSEGRLLVHEPGYGALILDMASANRGVIDHPRAMAGSVAARIAELVRDGLRLVVVGAFPDRGVSHADPAREDEQVRRAVAALSASPRVRLVAAAADVPRALDELRVERGLTFDRATDLLTVRRGLQQGDAWFLWNPGAVMAEHLLSFDASQGSQADLWDPWTGLIEPVGQCRIEGSRAVFALSIPPRESRLVVFRPSRDPHITTLTSGEIVAREGTVLVRSGEGGSIFVELSDHTARELKLPRPPEALEIGPWRLDVDGAGPDGPDHHEITLGQLKDWRAIPELQHVSGVGVYRAEFQLAEAWCQPGCAAELRLGTVHGSVRIRINDEIVSPVCVAPSRLDVSRFLRSGANQLEVEVRTTLKNRLDSLSYRPEYAYLADRVVHSQPYGLVGPVVLAAYSQAPVSPGRGLAEG